MNILFPSLFSLVFVAIGAAILKYAVKMAAKAQQSLSWPSIDGEIAHSAVLCQPNSGTTTAGGSTFKADIAYRYKVNGANYSSSKIALLDLSASGSGRAQSIVERYPDESRVQVFYNPADPSDAILEPGSTGGIKFLYLVGGIFAAGGFFFFVMSVTGHVHMAGSAGFR
jgi:hypothetical protein